MESADIISISLVIVSSWAKIELVAWIEKRRMNKTIERYFLNIDPVPHLNIIT
jgi:hypothetical protein